MDSDIYDPLAEYKNVFRDRFRRIAMQTFDELAQEADVDVAANRITCSKIYNRNVDLSFLNSDINSWKVRSVVLIIAAVAGVLCFFGLYDELDKLCKGLIVLATIVDVAFLFTKVYPKLRNLKTERESLCGEIDVFTNEAWKQMEPLNRLYDWYMMTRIMSKTIPQLEFDPYFTAQRLADMREVYNWNDSFNAERSVIYCHSGLINGNPFVLCRTRMMKMGTKTYKGSKTIHWTTRERDSEGKYRTVRHSETLTATVTAPYPEYYERTRLFYCNTAAPDLIFHRAEMTYTLVLNCTIDLPIRIRPKIGTVPSALSSFFLR